MSREAVRVTVTDPTTGNVLEEALVRDTYALVCAGRAYLAHTQAYPSKGTTVLTIKTVPGPEDGEAT